jgi:predicted nucleic acid-binding protein
MFRTCLDLHSRLVKLRCVVTIEDVTVDQNARAPAARDARVRAARASRLRRPQPRAFGRRSVRSSVDCLIAACALRSDLELLHRDRDDAALAAVSGLRQRAT